MPDINDHIEDPRDEMLERAPYRDRTTLEDDLTKFFATRLPEVAILSTSPRGAAKRFIGLIEQPHEREAPQVVGVPGKRDAQRVIDPYYDRVWHCAKRFTRLDRGPQGTIAENAKAIPWRGDDIGLYVRIIDETERMREIGIETYKQQAFGALRALLGAQR